MNTIKFDNKTTRMTAHRGLSGLERENTASAFVAAGNRNYYGIANASHNKHIENTVNGVGEFNTVFCKRRADNSH